MGEAIQETGGFFRMHDVRKLAYLTIDDAPSETFRRRVDELVSRGIPAIWYSLGRKLEERPDDAVYAIRQGHVIANHSYDHPFFSKLGLEEAKEQILRTDRIIADIYVRAGRDMPFKTFRFPYLDAGRNHEDAGFEEAIQRFLRDNGYRMPKFEGVSYEWYRQAGHGEAADVRITLDTQDWRLGRAEGDPERRDLEALLNRLDEVDPERGLGLHTAGSNEIVLMHEWIPEGAFGALISKLQGAGLTFVLPEAQANKDTGSAEMPLRT